MQKYKAWGNAPGIVPPWVMRAVGAKAVQAERHELALLLRLQRDNSSVVVYLGRCPRLYTFALSARVGHTGAHGASWALPLAISHGRGGRVCSARWTHGSARGIMGIAPCLLPWPWRACLQRALDTRGRTGHHGLCPLSSPMALGDVFSVRAAHTRVLMEIIGNMGVGIYVQETITSAQEALFTFLPFYFLPFRIVFLLFYLVLLQKVGRSCGSADYFQYFCSGAEAHNEPK